MDFHSKPLRAFAERHYLRNKKKNWGGGDDHFRVEPCDGGKVLLHPCEGSASYRDCSAASLSKAHPIPFSKPCSSGISRICISCIYFTTNLRNYA
ncbi:hypothetical protein J6590_093759 [Homalodisca vitripennis]|nr:hypothetical protein J6590_093759 [Homalodisca vitripennis]